MSHGAAKKNTKYYTRVVHTTLAVPTFPLKVLSIAAVLISGTYYNITWWSVAELTSKYIFWYFILLISGSLGVSIISQVLKIYEGPLTHNTGRSQREGTWIPLHWTKTCLSREGIYYNSEPFSKNICLLLYILKRYLGTQILSQAFKIQNKIKILPP